MKTKFGTHREVAECWAEQKQERGQGFNVYFEDETIFSYGSHFAIARFVDKSTVLFTTRRYSISTSKHIGHVWSSLYRKKNIKVFDVDNVSACGPESHKQNAAIMLEVINETKLKAKRARVHGEMYWSTVEKLQRERRAYRRKFCKKA